MLLALVCFELTVHCTDLVIWQDMFRALPYSQRHRWWGEGRVQVIASPILTVNPDESQFCPTHLLANES